MLSRSWNLLAKEMTIRKAAFGAIVSSAGREGTGLRLQTAKSLHLRQFIAFLAFHRRGCGCCWKAATRCLTLLRSACMTSLTNQQQRALKSADLRCSHCAILNKCIAAAL